jgi:hypothetical protein
MGALDVGGAVLTTGALDAGAGEIGAEVGEDVSLMGAFVTGDNVGAAVLTSGALDAGAFETGAKVGEGVSLMGALVTGDTGALVA